MSDHTTQDVSPEIPYGYCHCGCGQKTKITTESEPRYGYKKGEPRRYIKGHYSRTMWQPATERFWNNVDKRGPDQCWEWQAYRNDAGYGMLRVGEKDTRAHRFSYELHFGPISDDILVCHKCDNPCCVNPDHLFLGTTADNTHDMLAKGRNGYTGLPGERHHQAKLTADQVREIRRLCAEGTMQSDAAKLFGVSKTTVGRIVKRRNWVHVE